MDNLSIARPYANAVYALAASQQQVEQWHDCLQALACLAQSQLVQQLVYNPSVSNEQAVEFFVSSLEAVVTPLSAELKAQTTNLLTLMQSMGRLLLLPALYKFFRQIQAKNAGVRNAAVITAMPLATAEQQALQERLEKQFAAKLNCEFKLDPSIIGGMIVRCGSDVMDGSVKGRLQRLNDTLV